jgi:hypothetical protein
MVDIRVSVDEELLARAQRYAENRRTTVDQLVREYLEGVCAAPDPQEVAAEFVRLAIQFPGRSEPGWQFNREEIHDRGRRD